MNNEKLLDKDIDNLKHMLGADSRYKKRDWGFRNRFCAGGDDVASMKRLESNGLVREIKSQLFPNQIPKNGEFHIHHTKHINWWARMWMRFIGWGVTKVEHKDDD